jgi:hypothetical protein
MIILGKNPGILSSHVNTQEVEPQGYLSAKVFDHAELTVPLNPSDNWQKLGYPYLLLFFKFF